MDTLRRGARRARKPGPSQMSDAEPSTRPTGPAAARISFDRLRERTDELELLISGLCLLGLLSAPGALLDLYAEHYARLPVLLLAASATAMPMLIAIAYALAGCLLVHLMVRAYWVGLIGLRAVFPAGIDWHSPSIGPLQRERLAPRLPDLDAAIARADRWASMVFAVFVLAALVLACVGVWSTLIFVVGAWLGAAQGATNEWINAGINGFVGVIILAPLLLWIGDGLLARRWPQLARRRAFRLPLVALAWVIGILFPERVVGPVRLTLQSHTPRAVFLPLFALLVLGVPWAGLNVFRNAIGFDKFGNQQYLQGTDLRHGLRSVHYESLRTPEDRLRTVPTIPAPIHERDWLPLFLPYVAMRDNPVLAGRCASLPAPAPVANATASAVDSDAAAIARERADAERGAHAAACLARLWEVTLDGAPVPLDGFVVAERSDLGTRGLAGFIDLRGLAPGPHVIEVVWRPRPEQDLALDDYVPRRSRNVIPFVWSPQR